MKSISIIIPVYNEENTVIQILKKISKNKNINKFEIIVINDGSIDDTLKLLNENKTLYDKLINLKKNSGKGKAIIEGLKNSNCDFVFFQDADLEYNPDDLKKFIEKIEINKADLVMGSRFISTDRTVLFFWHMLGNKFITFLFNLLNNTTFTDIYCCYVLFKRQNLKINNLKCYGWGQQAELLTYLITKSKKIYEVSVQYNGRTYDEGKKIRYINVFGVMYQILFTKLKTIIYK